MSELHIGQELDTIIAEEVMGFTVLGTTLCGYHHFWYVPYDGQGEVMRPVYLTECVCDFRDIGDVSIFGHIWGCLRVVPTYSSNIKDAWAVVDKMEERGFILHPLRCTPCVLGYVWEARFITSDDPIGLPWEAGFIGVGDTPAPAICRAALKVMER